MEMSSYDGTETVCSSDGLHNCISNKSISPAGTVSRFIVGTSISEMLVVLHLLISKPRAPYSSICSRKPSFHGYVPYASDELLMVNQGLWPITMVIEAGAPVNSSILFKPLHSEERCLLLGSMGLIASSLRTPSPIDGTAPIPAKAL